VSNELVYYLIRIITFPFQWMPYSWIRVSGRFVGIIGFYLMRDYRKRSLSNVALASSLAFSKKEILKTAKKSFQNLAINCLEYPKLAREKRISDVIHCENPETANALYAQGHGIIFFCGHQANWEVLFLDGTTRMKGIAIGKPVKNKRLYQWIVSIRERHGGTIIAPRNAVREGLRALRKGVFMGIVGDQGMPDSGYSFPFLGRRAWTSIQRLPSSPTAPTAPLSSRKPAALKPAIAFATPTPFGPTYPKRWNKKWSG
jgi:Kdo2-lipid IVA lauroyltransferase/acyltransferase